eukprot:SM000145S00814  [mRNA]  locus=s145:253582:256381:+ [translate_table: standard]
MARRELLHAAARLRSLANGTRPKYLSQVTTQPDFPTRPEEVTDEWLTEVLRQAGTLGPSSAVRATASQRIGSGVGLLSLLHRLTLAYDGSPPPAGAPATLVAKFAHPSPEIRRMAGANGSYAREAGLYNVMGTQPPVLAAAAAGPAVPQALALRTPAIYCSHHDAASGHMVLVMEDLVDAVPLDQVAGATHAQAATVVLDAARLHARFWGSPELDGWAWLPKLDEERVKAFDAGEYTTAWPTFLALFGGLVPPALRALLSRLPEHTAELLDHLGSHPRTLLHGDLRLDNVYESCEPDLRRGAERRLLELYLQELEAVAEGGDGVYTLTDCWQDYRVATLYYFVLAVNLAGHVPPDSGGCSRVHALAAAVAVRSLAAIVDLRCLELLAV